MTTTAYKKAAENLKEVRLTSITGGFSDTQYAGTVNTYNSAIAIDPDYSVTGVRTSGMVCPTRYEKFSGSNVTGYPKFLITNPKNTLLYAYMSDGKYVSYTSAFASETLVGTPTSGAGNGATYYNNYVYLATPTDVSKYGPLNGTPTLTNNFWTSTLGKNALTNTTYPTLRGAVMPNHPMHVHSDGALYFGDVVAGQGVIHKIQTKKTTYEGDTDDGSSFNVLDLPFGYFPVAIESSGLDLVILAIQTTDGTINQGNAALFFWNPTDVNTFYNFVPLPDPIGTALINNNGALYIFTGNSVNGIRLSQFTSGQTTNEIAYIEEGTPPLCGAVDNFGSRFVWANWTTYPANSVSVMAYGSKKSSIVTGLHNIARCTSSGATGLITSLKFVQQDSNITPKLVIGWGDSIGFGIDKASSSATYNSVFRSQMVNIGETFWIRELRVALGATVDSGVSITPKIYVDDGTTSFTLTTINSTNFDGRYANWKNPELNNVVGNNNFFVEFTFNGTTYCPILMPIILNVEISQDES